MNMLLKQMLLLYVCLFALTGQAIADSLSDAEDAYNAKDYAKVAKLLRPLAEQGKAQAQYILGMMYDNGQGVAQDYKEAAKWYRLAAEQGNASAQSNLGVIYRNGQGVLQNYQEAAKWIRLSAEQGNASAQSNLGAMYNNGQGVPQDFVRAHMWLNIANANADSEKQKIYIGQRNQMAEHMNASQIIEAQELARKCTASKYKGC
jgi:TPR repeat protein